MAPTPEGIRDSAPFWIHHMTMNAAHRAHDGWSLTTVVMASLLLAITVAGLLARFCFRGRLRHPKRSANSLPNIETEKTEYPDMCKEAETEGWVCCIYACHAALTL